MKHIELVLVGFFAAMAVLPGCQQKASEEIDFGTVEDSVYRNEYFGLTVTLPSDWSIQDQEARQRMRKLGEAMVAGDDKNLEAAIKASEMTTVYLFAVFEHPVGTPVPYNPNISCVAERVGHLPGIKTGEDFLRSAKMFLESSALEVSFPEEISTASLGGREFGALAVEMPLGDMIIHQRHYTLIDKGYALSFVMSFTTDEEQAELQDILKTVTFQ